MVYRLRLRGDILSRLGIKIVDEGEGIVGKDSSGEVVLKYSKWETCFDDVDTGSYRVPYLVGAEILAKESVVSSICQFYEVEPKRHTLKF